MMGYIGYRVYHMTSVHLFNSRIVFSTTVRWGLRALKCLHLHPFAC